MEIFKFQKEKVLKWIEMKEWNHRRFAKVLGIHESYLSKIFSGKRQPSLKVLFKICNVTGFSLKNVLKKGEK